MTADEIKRALKTCSVPSACVGCVYKDADECIRALITDALDLVDNQDERIAIMQESMEELEAQLKSEPVECDIYVDFERIEQIARCGNCGEKLVFTRQKYCHECGKAVKWK